MKKNLLNFSFALLCFSASAQITITQADLPTVNSFVITANDTLYSGTAGTTGTNQVWNFPGLINHDIDTTGFVGPAGQMGASNFPTANMCIASPADSTWMYVNGSAGSFDVLGYYTYDANFGGWLSLNFNPTYKYITLPSTYNTSFNNTAKTFIKIPYTALPPADSIWLRESIAQTSNMDGWGNVTTPVGSYNALRQKITEIKIDSIFAHAFGSWNFLQATPDTDVIYRWWANGKLFPVLEMTKDFAGNMKKPTSYMMLSNVGIADPGPAKGLYITAFPNPAETSINFTFPDNAKGASFIIYDALGREFSSTTIQSPQLNVNTTSFEAGQYFFRYINKADGTVMNGKFVVTK
ncbi:MAG: T9SS type A sorting domain-containing protein [Bacteroidia bacterium]|nr:T9SS type A sorting domain-containing protein [Bacteroidia bacterium]